MSDLPWEGPSQFEAPPARKQMLVSEDVRRFALAGNATLTIVSRKTGIRYTFKVRKPDDFSERKPLWFVSVLKGPHNESDFGYIGQVAGISGRRYVRGKKCWPTYYPQSAAFEWFWSKALADTEVHKNLEVWHEGRCGKCGRKLTVPSSIDSGFGPECGEKL